MFVLRYTPLFALGAWSLSSFAVGLGPLNLESGLGQPLRATIPVFEPGKNIITARCISARVESFDGGFISNLQVDVSEAKPQGVVSLSSRQIINEPAITVLVEFDCGSRIRRSYQSLLDFPASASTLSSVGQPVLQRNRVNDEMAPGFAVGTLADEPGLRDGNGVNRRPPRQEAAAPKTSDDLVVRQRSVANTNRGAPTPAIRPVLKLSTESYPLVSRLKMSDVLMMPSARNTAAPTAPTDELLAARQAFAAMLRDEDFLKNARREFNETQSKLRDAQARSSTLTQQNESSRLAYADLERKSFSAIWVAVLSGLLLFSTGTIGWLVYSLRQTKRSGVKWWEGSNRIDDAIEPSTDSLFASSFHPEEDKVSSSFNMEAIDQLYARADADRNDPSGDASSGIRSIQQFAGTGPLEFQSSAGESRAVDDLIFSHTVGGLPMQHGKMLKVEVVSDVVQEAEFWMLLNDPQRAVQILEPHANIERPDSPVAWLYLIDLYRKVDSKEKYVELSERFKRIFNARIPKWEEQIDETEQATLEDFPGLIKRILDVWNDPDRLIPFLESLLIDDRDGERIGFDLPVYREIIMLIGIANETARVRLRQ